MPEKILRVVDLRKSYMMGRVPLHVLRGVSLSVEAGELLAVMGASGSGKSTLLHLLGALDLPDTGQVLFEAQDIFSRGAFSRERYRNQVFGFVYQFYHLLPELNVLENALLPRMVSSSIFSWLGQRHEAYRTAREILESLGLTDRIKHKPNELSGGERQRVALARALINRPRILLADEPTGNLDKKTGRGILSILEKLNRDGQTIVMVTHDPEVAEHAHRIIRLVDGVTEKADRPVVAAGKAMAS